jgi:hypothetical protein
LVLGKVLLGDWVCIFIARSMVFGSGVHATKMLREEVFAVEVVWAKGSIACIVRGWAEIAAPEAELDVLGVDVPLPFIFGGKVGFATVCGKGTGELSLIACIRGAF